MTCRAMGGPCDAEMTADTAEEMMKKGGEHVMAATDEEHMKIAEDMKNMPEEGKKEWNDMFMGKWEATPDSVDAV